MAPRPKTLLQHVNDGTFRIDRHAHLLAEEALPLDGPNQWDKFAPARWDEVLKAQAYYRRAPNDDHRLYAASFFLDAVQAYAGRPPQRERLPKTFYERYKDV